MISYKGKHFPKDSILLIVRWYVSYSLSYRDIEEIMLERGNKVDHSTLNRWVIEYAKIHGLRDRISGILSNSRLT